MISILEQFKADVNANAQIQRIVKGWDTEIMLEEKDTQDSYFLKVKGGRVVDVSHHLRNTEPQCETRISGAKTIIQGLFEGKVNPIRATNNGELEIYGAMSDQVKLDAIALILWGVC